MNKNNFSIIVLFLVVIFCLTGLSAADSALSLQLTPGISVPMGESKDEFQYSIGGGASLSADYLLPFAPIIKASGILDFTMSPTLEADTLSLISISAGIGPQVNITPKFAVHAKGSAGAALGLYGGISALNPCFGGDAGFDFKITPSFALGVSGGYHHYLSSSSALYQGVNISLGTRFLFGTGDRKPELRMDGIQFEQVFPVFYKHYDDHPVGELTVINGEKGAIEDLTVSFTTSQYMDQPKVCFTLDKLDRGASVQVPLYALFNDGVLSITEGTKMAGEIIAEYTFAGQDMRMSVSNTLTLYDRNAMTWDDDRKAAAFITAKDPEILRFSKNIAGLIRENQSKAVSLNFRIAMGLFEGLGLQGVNYVIDPQSSYSELSSDSSSVDYLQFPVQTMDYRAGDCDDLSILYAALLESTGIESAFITVPGHIFTAFNIGLAPAEAKRMFRNPGDLIYTEDKTWLPVEITLVQDGFLLGWEEGSKQWREHDITGKAKLYPVHDAWNEYEPVGLTGGASGLKLPDQDEIIGNFDQAVTRFVEMEISEKVESYTRRISESGNNPRFINKLGVLYAQYGMIEKASGYFRDAAGKQYAPAFINLGNIQFMNGDYNKALDSYEQAESMKPGSKMALLGIAKVNYELENYGSVREAFSEVQRRDPELAARFSYLVSESSEEGRASSAMIREIVVWDEALDE